MDKVSPALKAYHKAHNIPTVREQAAHQLELLAGDIRNGNMDLDALEHTLLHLCDVTYGASDRKFRDLWMWLRGLKAVIGR